MQIDELVQFMLKVKMTENCWLWLGSLSDDGYPSGNQHRTSFEHFIGTIPEGIELHHKCKVRSCVHPQHLQPVTRDEHGEIHRIGRGVMTQTVQPNINGRKRITTLLSCDLWSKWRSMAIDERLTVARLTERAITNELKAVKATELGTKLVTLEIPEKVWDKFQETAIGERLEVSKFAAQAMENEIIEIERLKEEQAKGG